MKEWPTDKQEVMIQAFYFPGDNPDIYGISGRVNPYIIREIGRAINESIEDVFKKGQGDYLLEAAFCYGERDEYSGGWIHRPYWEVSFVDFRPMEI